MIEFVIGLLIGMFIGGFLGILVLALASVAAQADKDLGYDE